MYFMNADGTENKNYKLPILSTPTPEPKPTESYDDIRKPVESYRPRVIHQDCSCSKCWKKFFIKLIFYAIIIYALYILITLATSS